MEIAATCHRIQARSPMTTSIPVRVVGIDFRDILRFHLPFGRPHTCLEMTGKLNERVQLAYQQASGMQV